MATSGPPAATSISSMCLRLRAPCLREPLQMLLMVPTRSSTPQACRGHTTSRSTSALPTRRPPSSSSRAPRAPRPRFQTAPRSPRQRLAIRPPSPSRPRMPSRTSAPSGPTSTLSRSPPAQRCTTTQFHTSDRRPTQTSAASSWRIAQQSLAPSALMSGWPTRLASSAATTVTRPSPTLPSPRRTRPSTWIGSRAARLSRLALSTALASPGRAMSSPR
mmetsp:Transcript_18315/g.42359  ORF Transcript_18315/g.42359 Transcript_18315/m.42359 type:complete len:218 (-) Transcript_18315:2178-2831(-)